MGTRRDRVQRQRSKHKDKFSHNIEETAINNGLVSPQVLIRNNCPTNRHSFELANENLSCTVSPECKKSRQSQLSLRTQSKHSRCARIVSPILDVIAPWAFASIERKPFAKFNNHNKPIVSLRLENQFTMLLQESAQKCDAM